MAFGTFIFPRPPAAMPVIAAPAFARPRPTRYHPTARTSRAGGGVAVKRVIFVCVENANRSQMAEAFARIHGAGRVEAASAGSRPSGRINPRAVEAMREVGYDLTAHTSKGLGDFNGQEFDAAVTMGC